MLRQEPDDADSFFQLQQIPADYSSLLADDRCSDTGIGLS